MRLLRRGFKANLADLGRTGRDHDRVIVLDGDTTRVKATGNTIDLRWTHGFTVRNGKVVAFEEYGDVSALVAEVRSAHARV